MANPDPSPLTRLTPGHSGNPGGRPRRTPLTEWARRICDEPAHQGTDKTNGEMVVRTVYNMAKGGEIAAAKLLWSYLEGPPTQTLEYDYKASCRRFAERYGLDADELIAEAERICALAQEGEIE